MNQEVRHSLMVEEFLAVETRLCSEFARRGGILSRKPLHWVTLLSSERLNQLVIVYSLALDALKG